MFEQFTHKNPNLKTSKKNLKHINSISMWNCLLIKKICFLQSHNLNINSINPRVQNPLEDHISELRDGVLRARPDTKGRQA
jgi:hypothetical protein